uniref:Small ribosomal subunit protein uS3c n=1 Tax=Chlamydomonas applanata TaxID=35704 RepID=A0A0S2LPK1_CHLAP|nr:ribosomal protein S3 [Chlamydomonas applanata]
MGQKVHPLGFRVGITKKHQSQWFARFNKNKYAQSVLEDRMLRETLTNLFPQLLNPVLKKKKRDDASAIVPRITQIKIERGLIPSEIGIQIHAENCDLIKSSIENLKINRDLVSKLQKTRRYLQHLRIKLNDLNTMSDSLQKKESNPTSEVKKDSLNNDKKKRFRPKKRLTKQQLIRRRLVLKRLKRRQSIRRRHKQLVYKRLFLAKKGNKVVQKLTMPTFGRKGFSGKNKKTLFKGSRTASAIDRESTSSILFSRGYSAKGQRPQRSVKTSSKSIAKAKPQKYTSSNLLKLRIKKKFVSLFINRMNNKFLHALKASLNETQKNQNSGVRTQQWSKKWNFALVEKRLGQKSLTQLTNFITLLEEKSLKKMESLRKDFITFGSISKAASFRYYQILTFLKQLKQFVSKLKTKQKFNYTLSKLNHSETQQSTGSGSALSDSVNFKSARLTEASNTISTNLLANKLNNIDNECRKIKFIEYLKQIVKKHRSENIYLYLATIAEARKDLRKLKQFTKRHASFLFGLNLNQTSEASAIQERLKSVLENSSTKPDFEKTLQDVFLEQIEKQRTIYTDNISLTPKISIKFYSVNAKSVKAKASVVADSVADALEKRKAFRKVIKDAKEELMRTSGVKGVKIQVSGRLNGAEIARSEWVRAGRVPLQTLRANLDYSYKTASTIYGIIGIKVWIFKGYVNKM